MKGVIKLLLAFLLGLLVISCEQIKSLSGRQQEQVVGGFSQQRKPSEEELALFSECVKTLTGAVYEPMNVATQIVAGVNYRFLCKGRQVQADGAKGRRFYAVITIHKPLPGQGEPHILSIQKQDR